MTRALIAGAVVLLAAGCGSGDKPIKPPANNGNASDSHGPVVLMPGEAPRTVVEAEAATDVQPHYLVVEDSEAAGGRCLTVPSKGCNGEHHQHIAEKETDPERTRGSAELAFAIGKEGEYVLWIRKWWCCSCGDSFSLQIDDGRPFVFGNDGTTPRHWAWLAHQEAGEIKKFQLSAGAHKLIFRNRGESGFKIDQVLFAVDPKYVPQGKEQPLLPADLKAAPAADDKTGLSN